MPSFQLHPITITVTLISFIIYPFFCGLGRGKGPRRSWKNRFSSGWNTTTRHQKLLFSLGMLSLFVANYWPVADIAKKDWLLARMLQQLLITLAAAPLLLMAIPKGSFVFFTRPRFVDFTLALLARPVPAILLFSAAAILAMTPALVAFEISSLVTEQLMQLILFLAALIVWTPILRLLPGVRQLSTAGRLAYLFVLSLLPNIPAIVLIFAKRSLYPSYLNSAMGVGAVADQELTGALAKLVSLAVFWGVALSVLLKADRNEEMGLDPDPITWDDVKRELDRNAKRFPHG